jgi:hypothetical protein
MLNARRPKSSNDRQPYLNILIIFSHTSLLRTEIVYLASREWADRNQRSPFAGPPRRANVFGSFFKKNNTSLLVEASQSKCEVHSPRDRPQTPNSASPIFGNYEMPFSEPFTSFLEKEKPLCCENHNNIPQPPIGPYVPS